MAAPMSTEAQLEGYTMTASLFIATGIDFIDVESEFLNLLLLQLSNQMQVLSKRYYGNKQSILEIFANKPKNSEECNNLVVGIFYFENSREIKKVVDGEWYFTIFTYK